MSSQEPTHSEANASADVDSSAVDDAGLRGDDARLYLPDADGWQAHIKQDSERYFCYQKHPGEDHFHLILPGELFLVNGHEKLCLQCSLRRGVVTHDRLYWQHRVKQLKSPPM